MLNQDTDATRRDPNVKDTPSLIASDRVEGTRVYARTAGISARSNG